MNFSLRQQREAGGQAICARQAAVGWGLCLFLCAAGEKVSAQGLVNLANASSSLVSTVTPWPQAGQLLFALVTAPPNTVDLCRFTPTGVLASNAATAGRILGGTVAVAGWPPGETRAFAVVGWSASLGTNFNPAWLCGCMPCLGDFGISRISGGAPGGFDPTSGTTAPTLNVFGAPNSGLSLSYPLSPDLYPVILTPPASQSASYGETVVLTVVAQSNPRPITYQWQFNGANLPGATNSQLALQHVTGEQSGAYSVAIWNGLSGCYSSLAFLEIADALYFVSQPETQTATRGSRVIFRAGAMGSPPLAFKWFLNGTNALTGFSTNNSLVLTQVGSVESGSYTVVVTNRAGSITSTPALLQVIEPVQQSIISGLSVTGHPGISISLEYRPDLSSSPGWMHLGNVELTNSHQWYFDVATSLAAQRYYRAVQFSNPEIAPGLDVHLIPALSLTGAIGSSVQIDCINQFGPIDAWVPLGTEVLTNQPQLFLDTSAVGQFPRLYRITTGP